MANYGFDGATLQGFNNMASWGMPKNSFNLDPLSGQSFGEYIPEVPDYSMPTGAPYSGSTLGDVLSPAAPLSLWDQTKQAFGNINWLDKTENGVTTQGAGGLALGAASALMNGFLGMKQYGLAKDTLKHNKEMFAKNFDAQRRTTNASLEDRQRSRIASNPGAYESVSSYMDKNGIK